MGYAPPACAWPGRWCHRGASQCRYAGLRRRASRETGAIPKTSVPGS